MTTRISATPAGMPRNPDAQRKSSLVSVIVPAYNAEGTIAQAVASVLGQEGVQLEVLVVDDGSTDGTAAAVESISDRRVQYLSSPENAGPGAARDLGVLHATGHWIAFLDADDVFHPRRLCTLLDAASGVVHPVVFDDLIVFDSRGGRALPLYTVHGRAYGARRRIIRVPAYRYIRSRRLIAQPLFERGFVQDNGIRHGSRRFGEDSAFNLALLHAGASMVFVPQAMYGYRVSTGSLTSQANFGAMRECIEECARWPFWGAQERDALAYKIEMLARGEALHRLARASIRGDWGEAMQIALSNPSTMVDTVSRAWHGVNRHIWRRDRWSWLECP